MNLIPKVKQLEIHAGFLTNKAVSFEEQNLDSRLVTALKKLPCDPTGTKLEIDIIGEAEAGSVDNSGEGYELLISENHISIRASSPAGAFYAIQTLRQLYKELQVPCLHIVDRPDFPHRGFYQDVTRGKIASVETIKKLIDDMAYYKLNSLQLYVEHVFEFEETKDLWQSTGCLTGAELRELDEYCHLNFIDFIPSLSTFGHLHDLLEQPKYKHLQVLKDFQEIPNFWSSRMRHHTIDPLNPESFRVIKSLIDQYAPHFTSQYFNICCDETFDLTRYADEGYDVGRLYVDFVKKIIDHVGAKDKKVMMWADILLKHPETIGELPEDTLFLNWYYGTDTAKMEEKIAKFAEAGRTQIVCPGTSAWSRLCEKVDVEEINITKMIELGYKYGAAGVLNTNWGDWGNPCSLELGMYGMVLGAEKSWSADTELDDEFYGAVNGLLYGSDSGIQALKAVSALQDRITWKRVCQNYFSRRYENGAALDFISAEEVRTIQREYQEIVDKLSGEKWESDEFRQEMLLAAEGTCVMAEVTAQLSGYEAERLTDTESWLGKYSEKWLKKNKPSELYRIQEMFRYYEEIV